LPFVAASVTSVRVDAALNKPSYASSNNVDSVDSDRQRASSASSYSASTRVSESVSSYPPHRSSHSSATSPVKASHVRSIHRLSQVQQQHHQQQQQQQHQVPRTGSGGPSSSSSPAPQPVDSRSRGSAASVKLKLTRPSPAAAGVARTGSLSSPQVQSPFRVRLSLPHEFTQITPSSTRDSVENAAVAAASREIGTPPASGQSEFV